MTTAMETLTWSREPMDAIGAPNSTFNDILSKTSVSPRLRFVVTHNGVDVRLSNDTTIFALRFEIEFQHRFTYRPPELSTRIQSLNSYINFQENVLTFVLLGMDGSGISSGNGTIVTIPIDHDQNFEVTSAYASSGTAGITEIEYSVSDDASDDGALLLEQNDPNPFATTTKIEFRVADKTDVKLVIYDVGGALVRTLLDSAVPAGVHRAEWDGRDDSGRLLDSGIYLYKLYAGVYSVTRKMVFLSEGSFGK